MMERTEGLFRVAVVQSDIRWCDAPANRSHLEGLLRGSEPVDLIVLPEMFATGFCTEPHEAAEAADGDGGTLAWMCRMAAGMQAALTGSVAVKEGESYYNRCYFVKPDGGVSSYDKRHLFTYGGEGRHYKAGGGRTVVEWRGVRLLLQVCYDLRFPVYARNRGDYDAAVYVANWPDARIGVWDTLLRARALENQCYVVGANRVGRDPAAYYSGHSCVIDAYGRTLACAAEGEESVVYATFDLEGLRVFRRKFPVLADGDGFELL